MQSINWIILLLNKIHAITKHATPSCIWTKHGGMMDQSARTLEGNRPVTACSETTHWVCCECSDG
jgi:hypothetical protein